MTSLLFIGAFTLANGNLWAGTGHQDSIERLQMSSEVLHALMTAPDKGIPEEVMSSAKCIVVVPNLVKGGFIAGASTAEVSRQPYGRRLEPSCIRLRWRR